MQLQPLFARRLSSRLDYAVFDLRQHADLMDMSGLSKAEAARAARFASDTLRNRFAIQRQILRRVLAERLGRDWRDISYVLAANGKPELDPAMGAASLRFNISHCEDMFAVAISDNDEVGIDIEADGRQIDSRHLLAIAATEAERLVIERLPAALPHQAVKRLWVAKEAALKLLGLGLQADLKAFAVPHQLLDMAQPHLVDALAILGRAVRVDYRHLSDPGIHIAFCTFSDIGSNNS